MSLNEELLDYLMSSDFTEDTDPEKLRSLLKSFRYFYRYQSGLMQSLRMDIDKFKYENNIKSLKLLKLESDIKNEQLKYNNLSNRKLSLKERFYGKLIK